MEITNSTDVLFLGSTSKSRRNLLHLAGISHKLLLHSSSECVAVPSDNFDDYVLAIACDKMQHLKLPELVDVDRDYIFVLTADTLVKGLSSGHVLGKPADLEHAKSILRLIHSQPLQVSTGCCLKFFEKSSGNWNEKASECWVTGALVEFCVSEDDIDLYFQKLPGALNASGASVIDDFGQNFLKSINGSYSAVVGLPLFELRKKLKLMGFKF